MEVAAVVVSVVVVVQLVAVLLAIWAARRWIRAVETEIREQIQEWITPPAAGEPAPLRQAAEQLGEIFGAAVAEKISQKLLGGAGAVQRQLKGLQADMQGDLVEQQTPVAQGLFDLFPSVSKRARRSPVAAMIIENIARRFAGGGFGSAPTSGSDGSRHSDNPFKMP